MVTPFKVTNPKNTPPGKSWIVTEEDIKNISEQNEALIEIRGRVISHSILIEDKLGDIICTVLFENNVDKCSLFKEMFLDKEFFTFMNKWKIFREITERKLINFESDKTRKEFCTVLKDVIKTRDNFAHGEIIFSGTKPQLHFTNEGKKAYFNLNDDYFNYVNNLFNRGFFIVEDLYKFLIGDHPAYNKKITNDENTE